MKVIVTGGAGFIGSHIVDSLVDSFDVIIVDNLSKGKRENINAKAKLCVADVTDKGRLIEVFEKEKPDYVIHEAAQINVRSSIENPVNDAKQNIIGALNVLECCRMFNVKKIVFASSGGAVYGEPVKLPCDENHPTFPMCPYGIAKLSVEHYIRFYSEVYGLKYVILRYSNVYGPRQDPKGEAGVISIFIDKMRKNEKVSIFGDGEQTRDYVYVKDVANANVLALKNASNKILNIGTGKQTSVNDLFDALKEITNSESEAVHTQPVPGEVRHTFLDISLARKELGWEPRTELKEGLKNTAS